MGDTGEVDRGCMIGDLLFWDEKGLKASLMTSPYFISSPPLALSSESKPLTSKQSLSGPKPVSYQPPHRALQMPSALAGPTPPTALPLAWYLSLAYSLIPMEAVP